MDSLRWRQLALVSPVALVEELGYLNSRDRKGKQTQTPRNIPPSRTARRTGTGPAKRQGNNTSKRFRCSAGRKEKEHHSFEIVVLQGFPYWSMSFLFNRNQQVPGVGVVVVVKDLSADNFLSSQENRSRIQGLSGLLGLWVLAVSTSPGQNAEKVLAMLFDHRILHISEKISYEATHSPTSRVLQKRALVSVANGLPFKYLVLFASRGCESSNF